MPDIITIERGNTDEALDLEKAKEVSDTLVRHYPGHLWMVGFQGRMLVIRHMLITEAVRDEIGRDGFSFALPHGDAYSASDLAHRAMIAGGQLLEVFGFPRGAWDGRAPVVPASWKHGQERFH